MKRSLLLLLTVLCIWTFSKVQGGRVIVGYPFGNSQSDGHLIIRRAANYGNNENVIVYVDGVTVAILPYGASYKGRLAPGPHDIAIQPAPISGGLGPKVVRHIDVTPGVTYTFTAGWIHGDTPVLK